MGDYFLFLTFSSLFPPFPSFRSLFYSFLVLCWLFGISIDHILLHCEVARELWGSIFRLLGVDWVMPRRVMELLATWRCQLGSHCIF